VLRSTIDLQGDAVVEAAVAELLEDGEVARHVRRARRSYHARRDAMAMALRAQLGEAVEFTVPGGGMAMWLRVRAAVSVAAWEREALACGVHFQPGRQFYRDGRAPPFVRVGFAGLDEHKLREAARRMAVALANGRRARR
jgi:GntR family transcriptional regulator/MocR family aminotransferase